MQLILLGIFVIGNLGVRIIAFIHLKSVTPKYHLLYWLLFFGFLPPLFFVQQGVAWNTIQFFYYFILLFAFLAALVVVKLKTGQLGLIIILLLLGLPSTLQTIGWHWGKIPTTLLEQSELTALQWLKDNSHSQQIILTYQYPQSQITAYTSPPVPMTYYNSAYVSFFTGRRVYLEDQNTAQIGGYPLADRLDKLLAFFNTTDPDLASNFLVDNHISYIYLVDNQRLALVPETIRLKKIFTNQKVRIYQFGD